MASSIINPSYDDLPEHYAVENQGLTQMRPRGSCRLALIAIFGITMVPLGMRASEAISPLPRPQPVVTANDPAAADLFAMPHIAQTTRVASGLVEAGDLEGAARLLDTLIVEHPKLAGLQADRAVIFMLAGDAPSALRALEAIAEHGSSLGSLLEAPVFAPLAADPALTPRLAALARVAVTDASPSRPVAASPVGSTAPVTAENTAWNPVSERLEPRFLFPRSTAAAVLLRKRKSAAHELLRDHVRRGRAAGNHGDLYDNRDRGHSTLPPEAHPQLVHVTYAEAARAADVDYGLNDSILFPAVTLGNSSTAITGGALWRSLPRLALTRADGTGPMRLWQNVEANHLYIYPAHRDFEPENGDLFPANTPYLLISRGSSGSDQPFLEAAAMILAAFRPDTKARLAQEKLIVPTLQMVFRRSLQNVRSREAYFSGAAHPVAFDASNINLARMVSLANSIAPGDIPPQVRIRVIDETPGVAGRDYFGDGLSEQLFDTPGAVARIWRSRAHTRTFTVSAEATQDPNDRPLAFHWRVLQGDPARVRITPLDAGRRARIEIDWHDPFRISESVPLITARVDIGVFASNGVHDSAPAMLSVYFPPQEARSYVRGANGRPRIASIDYAARPGTYADPMLFPRADWRDDYAYDAEGHLTGWTRTRTQGAEAYTAAGTRIVPGKNGVPSSAVAVTYPLRRTLEGALVLDEAPARQTED